MNIYTLTGQKYLYINELACSCCAATRCVLCWDPGRELKYQNIKNVSCQH